MTAQQHTAIDRPGVLDALRAIRAEAHRLEQPGMGYPMVSVRSLATQLGYGELLSDIIEACVDGGFDYCLDRTVPAKSDPDFKLTYPSQDVCYFGPDQLRSRLDCVDYRVYADKARF